MTQNSSQGNYKGQPMMALRKEDIGNMEAVLRGYYRSQINSLEKRKDRRLARQLLQDHLILPKSRQRTSKDAAYIKEVLGIESDLLDKLEDSRLIRRIHKSGANPIYEVSHDTLVEPILAERNSRLAITRFIKKNWKYAAVFLLFWFLFGMLFENTFEVIPEPPREAQSYDIMMQRQVIGIEESPDAIVLPLPPLVVDRKLYPSDSILIHLPLSPVDLSRLRQASAGSSAGDTISIVLAKPIEIPMEEGQLPDAYSSFSDVVVPIASLDNTNGKRLYARVSGNLRMTDAEDQFQERGITGYDQVVAPPLRIDLGDTTLRPANYTRRVPVNFSFQLSDLFENEVEKANVKNILGDRMVDFNYTVQLGAMPPVPPPPDITLPSVRGVEVQYSDGTKRFIPNNSEGSEEGGELIHIVAANETLYSIARKYNLRDQAGKLSTKALMELNGLKNNTISIGQTLRIPTQ